MGITVPAFNTMGKGSGMRGALSQLRSTISLARQWAITHRQQVYIVFPDFDITDFNNNAQEFEKACKAYAVYAITDKSAIEGDDISKAGEYITDWRFLPKDVIINNDKDLKQNILSERGSVGMPMTVNLGGKPDLVYTLPFNPDGSVAGSLSAASIGKRIYLAEGYMIVNTNQLDASEYEMRPSGQKKFIAVNGLTGGIEIDDYED